MRSEQQGDGVARVGSALTAAYLTPCASFHAPFGDKMTGDQPARCGLRSDEASEMTVSVGSK